MPMQDPHTGEFLPQTSEYLLGWDCEESTMMYDGPGQAWARLAQARPGLASPNQNWPWTGQVWPNQACQAGGGVALQVLGRSGQA